MKKILVFLIFPFVISAQEAFIASNDTICSNDDNMAEVRVSFNGISPFTFVYSINGVPQSPIMTDLNPYIIETKEGGTYSLVSYSDANDFGVISGQGLVTVLNSPIADFHAFPDTLTILYTTVTLTDESSPKDHLISWQWDFGDNLGTSNDSNTIYTYMHEELSQIKLYEVSLIVTDDNSCSDTSSKIITVTDDHWIWIPSSFTPDKDGLNDKLCISYNGIREAIFNFNVYDRFSNLVYSTNNIHDLDCDNGWDGTHQETGKDLPMSTYIYQIYYQDFEGWKHQETAEIIISR